MTMKDLKSLLGKLEALAESEMGQLQGGFASVSGEGLKAKSAKNVECKITNNCSGGNCIVGCGGTPAPGSGG